MSNNEKGSLKNADTKANILPYGLIENRLKIIKVCFLNSWTITGSFVLSFKRKKKGT